MIQSGQNSLLEDFCLRMEKMTGMRICIYDLGYFSVENDRLRLPYSRREHCSPLCNLVKSNAKCFTKCVEEDSWRAHKSIKAKQPFIHKCHVGLIDLIAPIQVGQRTVGAVFIGQCCPDDRMAHQTAAHKLASLYKFDEKTLLESINEQPKASEDKLKPMKEIAMLIADYISQIMRSVASQALADAHYLRDDQGRIDMDRVPNNFLDQLSISSGLIRNALQYIRTSYWQNITHIEVAEHVGLSISHFSRLFKKTTGMTFRRCLVEARLSAAIWLIKKTDLKVKEISELLGYAEPSSFQRALYSHTNVTATEMRERQPMPWHMGRLDLMPADQTPNDENQ